MLCRCHQAPKGTTGMAKDLPARTSSPRWRNSIFRYHVSEHSTRAAISRQQTAVMTICLSYQTTCWRSQNKTRCLPYQFSTRIHLRSKNTPQPVSEQCFTTHRSCLPRLSTEQLYSSDGFVELSGRAVTEDTGLSRTSSFNRCCQLKAVTKRSDPAG